MMQQFFHVGFIGDGLNVKGINGDALYLNGNLSISIDITDELNDNEFITLVVRPVRKLDITK